MNGLAVELFSPASFGVRFQMERQIHILADLALV